ncbi:MAG: chemotaxis protein CheD [Pelovirga sp.]
MNGPAELSRIYLEPAELAFCLEPAEVATILGSCIAVVLYSSKHQVGAICHAMLPYNIRSPGRPEPTDFKYVDSSIHYMIDRFEAHRIKRQSLVAKVFGGADVLRAATNVRLKSVGQQNIESALKLLDTYRLRVVANDTGGDCGRKLIFFPHSGQVFLKRLSKRLRDI